MPQCKHNTGAKAASVIVKRSVQGKGDSGLKFAQGSHRDISAHFHGRSREQDLSRRGYSVSSVGEAMLQGSLAPHSCLRRCAS